MKAFTQSHLEQLKRSFVEFNLDDSLFEESLTRQDLKIVFTEGPFSFYIKMDKGKDTYLFNVKDVHSTQERQYAKRWDGVKNDFRNWVYQISMEIEAKEKNMGGKKEFPQIINEISNSFVEIYNQAYKAERLKLNHICGIGYRKALEFLIKDYAINTNPPEERDSIINNPKLAQVIREYIPNEGIKLTATRAVWLGNDHAHYNVRWEGKTLEHLKELIDKTVHWMVEYQDLKQLLEDMPDDH